MAVIETKYSVGDIVWFAGTETERKQHPCPDCKGLKQWSVTSPAGSSYHFPCPRCSASYSANNQISLAYTAHIPVARRLTIGSVQFNSAPFSYDSGARYMCRETGIGSGQVYDEAKLFESEAAALVAAQLLADENNSKISWCVEQYNQSLSVSDYQLEHALIKDAADHRLRAGSLLYNLTDLFTAINEATDEDAMREAVDEYKEYYWKRDIEKLADELPAASRNASRADGVGQ